jgi:hypothetical protein
VRVVRIEVAQWVRRVLLRETVGTRRGHVTCARFERGASCGRVAAAGAGSGVLGGEVGAWGVYRLRGGPWWVRGGAYSDVGGGGGCQGAGEGAGG